jgi:hypothetical protein
MNHHQRGARPVDRRPAHEDRLALMGRNGIVNRYLCHLFL